MAEENKVFHEFGYSDERFETVLSENLHCAICSCVFKDPVMCKNEHCFCRGCITKHLENHETCPCCNKELTTESLEVVPRILRNLLSEQKIRCDYHDRGCEEIVQLGNLPNHVAVCGKAPVVCVNKECSMEINREDRYRHEGKECKFRQVECQNCKEISSMVHKIGSSLGGLCEHVGKLNTSVNEMKTDLVEVEEKIEEMKIGGTDPTNQSDQSGDVTEVTSHRNAYVVAGGSGSSVEIFDKASNSWIGLMNMNKCRTKASSVVYHGHILVTGGVSDDNRIVGTVEQLSRNVNPFVPPCWSNLPINLPKPLAGHSTVLYKDRLIALGGYGDNDSDMIYEMQLNFPFSTRVLAKLPFTKPIQGFGVALVNDKILIFGGGERSSKLASDKVTMYDIVKNEFQELSPLPYPVCRMATVKFEENVVLVGGSDIYNGSNAKKTVVSYNVESQESTMLPPMKESRCDCCAVADGNTLVVMGGKYQKGRHTLSVEAFDFATSEWSDFPPMKVARCDFIAEIV